MRSLKGDLLYFFQLVRPHARKRGEEDLSETCRGSRFFVQAVCNSLSITHTLSHTTSQAMLSGEGDLAGAICQCSASNVKGTVEGFVRGLTAMRSLNRPHDTSAYHISRRRSKTSTSAVLHWHMAADICQCSASNVNERLKASFGG